MGMLLGVVKWDVEAHESNERLFAERKATLAGNR